MDLEHFGEKNQFGLPHGRWYGVNKFNDTIYDINYEHGWLHGNFDINVSYWPSNWVRTYDMGVEIDSSYRENKGERNRTLYFASPGKLSKQLEHFVDGRIHRVDTVLYAQKLTPVKTVRFDGWTSMIASVDSAQKILHTKRYFAPDSLEIELWTDYAGNKKEWKQYHKKNGALKIHWILNGIKTIEINGTTDEYDTRGNLIGTSPRTKTILLATRFTYDLSGQLIKTENLVDGNPEP
jgi:YD repeat-containing protein